MEKRTLEQVVINLGMGDYNRFIEDKMLEHETVRAESNDLEYKTALNDYIDAYNKIMNELDRSKRKLVFHHEEKTTNLEAIENKYMYKSGFEDGFNLALGMMSIVNPT